MFEKKVSYISRYYALYMAEIVLSGSRTDFSDYNLNPFIAFAAGFPSKILPISILRKKLYPEVECDPEAKFAPYGLRKVEAALMEEFDDVITTSPSCIDRVVDEKTKVVGLTLHDPLGLGYVSTTYSSLVGFGGVPMTAYETQVFMKKIRKLKEKYGFSVVAGGVGVWQLVDFNLWREYGIDIAVIGDADEIAVEIFKKAMNGEKGIVRAFTRNMEKVPLIKKPSFYGAVEITRGCGKGCAFCAATIRKRYDFPMEKILHEVKINAHSGTKMIMLVTEDIFLYGSKRFVPNREKLVKLLTAISKVESVKYIQPTHASWSPAVYDPKSLESISEILYEKTPWEIHGEKYVSAIIGIESGSVRLMKKLMRGKALPLSIDKWPEIVIEGAGIYNDNHWKPGGTLILGMPGETEDDALRTLELVDDMKSLDVILIPLLFVPIDGAILQNHSRISLRDLNEVHWEIIARCWRHNLIHFAPEVEGKLRVLSLLFMPYVYYKHGINGVKTLAMLGGLQRQISFFNLKTKN